MTCGKCKADIDNDSIYCDQCGEELLICPKCGNPGKGKICTQDGTKLVSAKEINGTPQTSSTPTPASATGGGQIPEQEKTVKAGSGSAVSAIGTISFANKAINVNFNAKDGDIIGRKNGSFVNIFGKYSEVSGTHAKITLVPHKGWHITDLGSSNGTKYNGKNLNPNAPQLLEDKSFVQIAHIEFYVQIT